MKTVIPRLHATTALVSLLCVALFGFAAHANSASACRAESSTQAPAIVELYTSEGCSSCPPADRWASKLKGRGDVLALAFHVNYWDRLGWPDRFATAANTERQQLLQRAMGTPYVYTPQVVLNGQDLRAWSSASLKPLGASAIKLSMSQEDHTVRVVVAASSSSSPQRLAGYWAVLEDGHRSRVKAGENAGETLAHDHVVTLYKPVPAWGTQLAASQTFMIELPAATSAARRIAFVVTDAGGARPLQALVLQCPQSQS